MKDNNLKGLIFMMRLKEYVKPFLIGCNEGAKSNARILKVPKVVGLILGIILLPISIIIVIVGSIFKKDFVMNLAREIMEDNQKA